jgi:hypothetical protein
MRVQPSNTMLSKLVSNINDGLTEVVAMDNAPSGASLIVISSGRWEMEAIWAMKVTMMVDDWKEPLYTWYL